VHFGDAVGDFGDLKDGVDLGLDALQLAGAFERGDPLAEVVEGQRIPLCERVIRKEDYKGFRSGIVGGSASLARKQVPFDKLRAGSSTSLGMTNPMEMKKPY
jgi:hypothetical protein